MIDEAAASELDALRVKYKAMVEENNALSIKVICEHVLSHYFYLYSPLDKQGLYFLCRPKRLAHLMIER